MKSFALFFLFVVFSPPAQAGSLVYDNFSGPVANATGQYPTIGPNPWVCSGPGYASCVRGGGQLTESANNGTIYYLMNTSVTPMQVSYQFTDSAESPALVIAVTRNGTLADMWHANGYNSGSSFVFTQSYWCDTTAGCATPQADVTPAFPGQDSGPCPATVPNHSYIGSLDLYANTAVATLQDAATGAVLCTNTASDPKLQSLIGPNFYLESYYNSPSVAFTSLTVNATAPARLSPLVASAPANVRGVAAAIDLTLQTGNGPFTGLLQVPPSQLPGILAQFSGEIASLSAGSAISLSTSFMTLLLNPFLAGREDLSSAFGPSLAHATGRNAYSRFSAWFSAYGNKGDDDAIDATTGAHRENQAQGGMAMGIDYRPTNTLAMGAALGEARLDWGLPDLTSSGRANVTQLGLYLSKRSSLGYANLGLTYSNFAVKTVRDVSVGATDQYDGSFDGSDLGARFELGEQLLGHSTKDSLTMFVAAENQLFMAPSYGENTALGSPIYALAVQGADKDQIFTDVGLKLDTGAIAKAIRDIHASLAWRHAYYPSQSALASFAGTPGFDFAVAGVPVESNTAVTSVGAQASLDDNFTFGIDFDGAFGQHSSSYGGSATLRRSW